ncbi:hypothetical protein QR680_009997 [Steinernema hermaphroditum]|uniref:Uncharacterized protein n=1 Tax=Steinernema hermaphroditum TaxID=289476 RepID=A0AA39IPW7_9BILA|nr:hypothetical protein QR680_009997 [Steinernema hermaphroditum]
MNFCYRLLLLLIVFNICVISAEHRLLLEIDREEPPDPVGDKIVKFGGAELPKSRFDRVIERGKLLGMAFSKG